MQVGAVVTDGGGGGGGVLPAVSVSAFPENVPVTPLKFSVTEQFSVLLLLIVQVAGTAPVVCALADGAGGQSATTATIVERDTTKGRSVDF